jgi:hypothetical protein
VSPSRLPWAGLLALLLVLALDRAVLGTTGPWEDIASRLPPFPVRRAAVAQDRAAFRKLAAQGDAQPRVFALGSSRGRWGFKPERSRRQLLGDVHITRFAHALIFPFEMLSLSYEIADHDPDAVVFLISEMDTHIPLYLPRGSPSVAARALGALMSELPLGVALREWKPLLNVGLDSLLLALRYRVVLGGAGLDELRRFPLVARLRARRGARTMPALVLDDGEAVAVPAGRWEEIRNDVVSRESGRSRRTANEQMEWVGAIKRGEHARVQMALLERAVALLTREGAAVIIVEPPLDPLTADLYDVSIRGEFLAFAARMRERHGAHFVPLEQSGPFPGEEFADLVHLDREGARKLTRATLVAVRSALRQRGRALPSKSGQPKSAPRGSDVSAPQ